MCDEPTSALDSASGRDILVLLERINQSYGTTILLVPHNTAIRRMAHKVLTIRDGKIVDEQENAAPVSAADILKSAMEEKTYRYREGEACPNELQIKVRQG